MPLNRLLHPQSLTRLSVGVLLAWLFSPGPAASSPVQSAKPQPQTAGVRWQDVPELQQTISVDIVATPLRDALKKLSESGVAQLRSSDSRTEFQRITLESDSEPLYKLMDRIVLLLSHGAPATPHQYHWEKRRQQDGAVYVLVRDDAARAAEETELSRSYNDALRTLKEHRDAASLPPERLATFQHHQGPQFVSTIGVNTFAQALKDLTDAQLEALRQGESVYVPYPPLARALEANYDRVVAAFKAQGDPRAFPPFQMGNDAWATLQVNHSFFTEEPFRPATYMISLTPGRIRARSAGGVHLDGNEVQFGEGLLSEKTPPDAPVYDLTPILDAPGVTDRQRKDAAFNLAALAKTAHVGIAQEYFYRPAPDGTNGLRIRKGTLPVLMNAICRTWDYQVTRNADGAYLLWSRSWAQDQQNDIPEPRIEVWRRQLARDKGTFTLDDRLRIAREFRWGQAKATLPLAIPEMGDIGRYRQYLSMRVVALMNEDVRAAALQPGGVPFAALPSDVQSAILHELDFTGTIPMPPLPEGTEVTEAAVQASRISLRAAPSAGPEAPTGVDPQSLHIDSADGKTLWAPVSVQ